MLGIKDHPGTNGSLSHTRPEGTESGNGSPFHLISVRPQDGVGTSAAASGNSGSDLTSASRLTEARARLAAPVRSGAPEGPGGGPSCPALSLSHSDLRPYTN